jgi:membrane-associated phospholipid phosphatase
LISTTCALGLALAVSAASAQTPPAAELPPDRPFTELLTNLARDIRALPSSDTAMILGAGGGTGLALRPVDDNVANWGNEHGPSSFAGIGEFIGDGWVQGGVAVATYVVGRANGDTKAAHVGSDLIRGHLLNGLTTRVLKLTVGRERPRGGGHSFPSGHTSATFVSASILDAHFGWKVGVPAYAFAGFVGWSRLREDAHWLTDVIAGGTIGTIVGRTVARGHRERGWNVIPSASAQGFGVFVSRTSDRSRTRHRP